MMLDLLVRAKTILTMDEDRPTAQCAGIFAGRILGFDEQIQGLSATPNVILVPPSLLQDSLMPIATAW